MRINKQEFLLNLLSNPVRRTRIEKHFWDKVEKRGDNECWEWVGKATSDHGYGRLRLSRKVEIRAHRVSLILSGIDVPDNKLALHKCDNAKCVNPNHLFVGTYKDNTQDMLKKKRHKFGSNASWSKLTESDVLDIRRKYATKEASQRDLAKEYGMGQQSINLIIRKINWAWL